MECRGVGSVHNHQSPLSPCSSECGSQLSLGVGSTVRCGPRRQICGSKKQSEFSILTHVCEPFPREHLPPSHLLEGGCPPCLHPNLTTTSSYWTSVNVPPYKESVNQARAKSFRSNLRWVNQFYFYVLYLFSFAKTLVMQRNTQPHKVIDHRVDIVAMCQTPSLCWWFWGQRMPLWKATKKSRWSAKKPPIDRWVGCSEKE